MAFRFESRAPDGTLSAFVASVWFAHGRIAYAREQIAPTGATVAVINLGDPILHATVGARATRIVARSGWLTGPHDQPSLNEPQGETHCYGVVATPIGCEAVFGLDPRSIRGRVVPLEDWSAGVDIRNALDGVDPDEGLTRLIGSLASSLRAAPTGAERIARAVAWLEADPTLGVGAVASRLGISHAHLDREFARVVGLTPRRLTSILRVRRLLDELDVSREADWSDLAARYGWYDQSHLIRDFKRATGASPTAYVSAQRANFEESEWADAGGFVPEGDRTEIKSVQDPPT